MKNIQRKCPSCDTWNKDEEYCTNCGQLLDPDKLRKEEKLEREKQKVLLRKPNELDHWLEKVEKSKNPFIWLIYRIVRTVWVVFAAIITFILYAIAAAPG